MEKWTLIFAPFLLIFASFLNFISALYSDIDISKIDLSRVNRKKKPTKKIIYIIKNGYFLFVGICIILIFFHISSSRIIIEAFFAIKKEFSASTQLFWER